MIVLLWFYAVIGSLYTVMYLMGIELVVKHADGPLWWMMAIAPVVLGTLIWGALSRRRGA